MARGRGGFPRGGRGGPPAGFPPRGLAPPFIGGRGGGRGGRGGRGGGPPGAYGRPRGDEPCFNFGGEEDKGDEDEEGEEAVQQDEAGQIEIVDQEPIIEKQQVQVPIQEQAATPVEDEKVQAVVEAVAALGVGEQEE